MDRKGILTSDKENERKLRNLSINLVNNILEHLKTKQ